MVFKFQIFEVNDLNYFYKALIDEIILQDLFYLKMELRLYSAFDFLKKILFFLIVSL